MMVGLVTAELMEHLFVKDSNDLPGKLRVVVAMRLQSGGCGRFCVGVIIT